MFEVNSKLHYLAGACLAQCSIKAIVHNPSDMIGHLTTCEDQMKELE